MIHQIYSAQNKVEDRNSVNCSRDHYHDCSPETTWTACQHTLASCFGGEEAHMHPACSLHGCLILQVPRDDPGNENGVSTCNSGTDGWTRWLGVCALGNSLPHVAQVPPKQIQLCTHPYLSLGGLPVSATGENLEARHCSTPFSESGNHSPSLCRFLPNMACLCSLTAPSSCPQATPHLSSPGSPTRSVIGGG